MLSIARFAFDCHTPSIFIFVRIHEAHLVVSGSLSAHFRANDSAGRVGLKGRNYPVGARDKRLVERRVRGEVGGLLNRGARKTD
jgi:hypothetical protein